MNPKIELREVTPEQYFAGKMRMMGKDAIALRAIKSLERDTDDSRVAYLLNAFYAMREIAISELKRYRRLDASNHSRYETIYLDGEPGLAIDSQFEEKMRA